MAEGEIEAIYNAGGSGKCYDGPQFTAGDYGTAPPLCDPDTLAPIINLCGTTQTVLVCDYADGAPALPPEFLIGDDCDPSPISNVVGPVLVGLVDEKVVEELIPVIPSNLYSYDVEGVDAACNSSQCSLYVQLQEKKPEIICPLGESYSLGSACTMVPPAPVVSDPCDHNYQLDISPSILTPGFQEVMYTVTSSNGQSASCSVGFQVVSDSACPQKCETGICEE